MLQGSIKGYEHSYQLDDYHVFQTGKPMLVCGNTAAMVGEDGISWLSKHFQVNYPSKLIHNIIVLLALTSAQVFASNPGIYSHVGFGCGCHSAMHS